MAPEDVRRPDRGGPGGRRALLDPADDVAGADEDDDRLQAGIAGQDPFEDQVERLRSDPGAADVPHVRRRRLQALQVSRRLEQALQRARPARILVEQVPLGLTAAGHEDAVEPARPASARHLASALSLAVDLEPHEPLELREDRRVRVEMDPLSRRKHVVRAPMAQPPARAQLGRRDGQQQDGRGQAPPHHAAHARLQARQRGRCPRRST